MGVGMNINRRAARRDKNEPEIIEALVAAGASVLQVSAAGCSDLIVGYHGVNYLLEVKSRKGKLTPMQEEFLLYWQGEYAVVRSAEGALKAIGAIS